MTTVYLGLGSNIDPETNLKAAAVLLRARWPTIRFSPVYRTGAIGYEAQDDFLNAVARLETDERPPEIFDVMRSIEKALKKATPFKDGPRTIDLDLLLYGTLEIRDSGFEIPHPRMHQRRFVLEPLMQLIDAEEEPRWAPQLEAVRNQQVTKTDLVL